MQIIIKPMRDIAIGHRMRLRELTIGPVAWGLWSLTFHDGSTWAAMALDDAGEIQAWACLTQEYDVDPMIGVYVPPENRKEGLAPLLVTSLCRYLLGQSVLLPNDVVVASTWRWPAYFKVLASCGLICKEWA